ncbi:MAG: lnt [Chlamydiales bacterium]|nr:lnt [Chlamydiales bacterium]
MGTVWFTTIQLLQLRWMASHPYLYIYLVMIALAFLMGVQWGLLSVAFFKRQGKKAIGLSALSLASFWTLQEWLRLFFLSGFPFNPVGIALAEFCYSAQLASLGGIYFLSFVVIAINSALALIWQSKDGLKGRRLARMALLIIAPYLAGALIYHVQQANWQQKRSAQSKVLLIQTAFPIEEEKTWNSMAEVISFALYEWEEIFKIAKSKPKEKVDLTVIPENAVLFQAYKPLFPLKAAEEKIFKGHAIDPSLYPPLEEPFAVQYLLDGELVHFVSHAFLAQTLANSLNSFLIVGLEECVDPVGAHGKKSYYSAALLFKPFDNSLERRESYHKQVLVPMGEYIPFSFLKGLAASYGISDSFTSGSKDGAFEAGLIRASTSICYEEGFSFLVWKKAKKGCNLLVNLTNDGWYPNSSLPLQHFHLGRMRAIENGISLVRATNTGITAAVDPFGQTVKALDDQPLQADRLFVTLPLETVNTPYRHFGDAPLILFSLCALLFSFLKREL